MWLFKKMKKEEIELSNNFVKKIGELVLDLMTKEAHKNKLTVEEIKHVLNTGFVVVGKESQKYLDREKIK